MAERPLRSVAQARSLTRRAHAAFAGWLVLAGGLLLGCVIGLVDGLVTDSDERVVQICACAAVAWLAAYVLLCAGVVWSYRRRIGPLRASDDDWDRQQAQMFTAVRLHIVSVNDLVGVHLGRATATPAARWVNSTWPLVGHVAAVGLLVIGLSRSN